MLKKKLNSNGYSYLEIIIAMALASILSVQVISQNFILIKQHVFTQENYLANIACENLLNIILANLDQQEFISQEIFNSQELFYLERFNFIIRLNKINTQEFFFVFNHEVKDIKKINANIFCDNNFFMQELNYLITIDIHDKQDKFLKRLCVIK